ncbi:hypothetical protein T05_12130 [Trichinella murrelli]|uniref:Uncharacterized protein n=1 Tax=Trichinella murrelli TaxID=144512 RepID=A0A0V0SX21_9BILA|nr:hypothetical protein T05_13774 [Trichinella murrelli]KRX31486.1 hypothetical protein T05_12130 [Trichinella murrelli]
MLIPLQEELRPQVSPCFINLIESNEFYKNGPSSISEF